MTRPRVNTERALIALQFVASDNSRPKHIEEPPPKGVGIQTLFALADGGFIDDATPDHCFKITDKGRHALETGVLDWPLRGTDAQKPTRPAPAGTSEKKRRKTGPFATQKQIAAVFKAAVQAGISVEMRIEGDVIRFVPCDGPTPEPDRHAIGKPYF